MEIKSKYFHPTYGVGEILEIGHKSFTYNIKVRFHSEWDRTMLAYVGSDDHPNGVEVPFTRSFDKDWNECPVTIGQ